VPPAVSPGLLQPAQPEVFNFRFSAGKTFKDKLERLAEVLGVENPARELRSAAQADMAEVLEEALDLALEKKDPKRRLELRREREERQAATVEESRLDKGDCAGPRRRAAGEESQGGEGEPAKSHYVPSARRERAFERAGRLVAFGHAGGCEYTAPEGTRCTSRTGLEIEHERPFAIYHSHDERYLRVSFPAWGASMAWPQHQQFLERNEKTSGHSVDAGAEGKPNPAAGA
jgi:hypothetical protein